MQQGLRLEGEVVTVRRIGMPVLPVVSRGDFCEY